MTARHETLNILGNCRILKVFESVFKSIQVVYSAFFTVKEIRATAKTDCDGCEYFWCGQNDHTCLMYDTQDLWEQFHGKIQGADRISDLIRNMCKELVKLTGTQYTAELETFICSRDEMDAGEAETILLETFAPPTSSARITQKFVKNISNTIADISNWSIDIFMDYAAMLKDQAFKIITQLQENVD